MVGVGEEDTSGDVVAAGCVLGDDRRREMVDGLAIGGRLAVVEEQIAVRGFAEDFGWTGDIVANLLEGKLLIVGHERKDLAAGLQDKAKVGRAIQLHGGPRLKVSLPT